MNAPILDTSNFLRSAVPGGAAAPSPATVSPQGSPQASNSPSFSASLKLLFGQAELEISNIASGSNIAPDSNTASVSNLTSETVPAVQGDGVPDAVQTLKARLTEVLNVIQTDGAPLPNTEQLQALVADITSALETFEATSGINLVAAVQPYFTQPPETDAGLGPSVQYPAEDMSGLIGFVDVVLQVAQTTEPANNPSSPSTPKAAPLPWSPIPVQTVEASMDVETVIQTAKTADAPVTDPVDIQIAASVAQRVVDKVKTAPTTTKATQEFVAAVASGQSVQQTPTQPFAAVFPMMGPELRTNLPQQEPLFAVSSFSASAAPDEPKTVQDAPKPSRFTGMLVDQIKAARITEGLTKVELSPRGLGAVEIEVTSDSNGVTNVVVRAENTMVLNALREMREPWAQIPALQDAGSLSFEDMSHRQDGDGEEHSGYVAQADEPDAITPQDQKPTDAPVILGNQLDLTT